MSQRVLFPDCWKFSLVLSVFKNIRLESTAKRYHPVCVLSVVSKVFEKPATNRIADQLEKCGFFLILNTVFLINCGTSDSCI